MSYKLYSEDGLYHESDDTSKKDQREIIEIEGRAISEETKHSAYFTISIEKIKDLIRQYFKDHVIDPNRAPDLKLDDIVKIVFESYGMDMSEALAVEVRVDYPYISQGVLDRHKFETIGEEISAGFEKGLMPSDFTHNPNCKNGVCYVLPPIDINKPKETVSPAEKYGPLFSYIRRKSIPGATEKDIDYSQPPKRESDDE